MQTGNQGCAAVLLGAVALDWTGHKGLDLDVFDNDLLPLRGKTPANGKGAPPYIGQAGQTLPMQNHKRIIQDHPGSF